MSLEQRYNQAAANTYVGTVRTRQAATAPTNQTLVNFLDGQQKTRVQDDFQTEFTRNASGKYLSAGAQPPELAPSTSTNSDAGPKTNTRWTNKSFKLAFDGQGPTHLINGFYTNQFRPTYKDINGTQRQVHMYTPAVNKRFEDANSAARARIASSPSGAPTGF
jgi:hypothetical protein